MIDWRSSIKNGDTVHIRFAYTHAPSGKRYWVLAKVKLEDGKAELCNLLADGNGISGEAFSIFDECKLDEFAEWLVPQILNGEVHHEWVSESGDTLAFGLAYGYTCEATLYRNYQGDSRAKELYETQREWHRAMREIYAQKGA